MSFSVDKREATGLGRLLGGIMTVATKHKKKGSLGEANNFYYHSELKRWVERGKEDEAIVASAIPPPPTTNQGLGSVTAKRRRPLTQRYKLQDNLQVAPQESREAASGDLFLPPPPLPPYPVSNRGVFLPPPRQGLDENAPSGPASASSDCSSASSSTATSTRSNSATSLVNGFCTAFQSDFRSSTSSNDGGSGRSSCEGSDKEASLPLAAGWALHPVNPGSLRSVWAEQPDWRSTEPKPTFAGAASPSASILCTFDSTQIMTQIAAALDSISSPSATPLPLVSPCSPSASVPSPESLSTPTASGGICSLDPEDGGYSHRADCADCAAAVVLLKTGGEDAGAAAAAKCSTAVPVSVSTAAAAAAAAAKAASGACPHGLLDALCDNATALSRTSSLSLSFSDFARFDSLNDAELCRNQQQQHPPQQHPPQQHPPQSHQRESPPSCQAADHGCCCKLAAAVVRGEADPQRPQQSFPLLQPPMEQLQCGCCRAEKGFCSTFSFAVSPLAVSSALNCELALNCEAGEHEQYARSAPLAAADSNGVAAVPNCPGTEAAAPVADGGDDRPDASTLGRSKTMTASGAGPLRPHSTAAATQGAFDFAAVDAAVRVLKELRSSLLSAPSPSSCWVVGGSSSCSANVSAEAKAPGSSQYSPCSVGQGAAAAVSPAAVASATTGGRGSSERRNGCSTVQPTGAVVQPAAAATKASDRAPTAGTLAGSVEASLTQAAQALAGLGLLHTAAVAVTADAMVAAHKNETCNAPDASSADVEDRAKPPQLQAASSASKPLPLATASLLLVEASGAVGDDATADGVPTPEVSPRRGSLRNRTAAGPAAVKDVVEVDVGGGNHVEVPPEACRPPASSPSPSPARSLGLFRKIRREWAAVQGQLAAAFDGYAALSKHVGVVAARQRSMERRCMVAAAAQQHQRELDHEQVRQRDEALARQLVEERTARAAAEVQLAEERAVRAELERQLQLVLRERCSLGTKLGPYQGLNGADGLGLNGADGLGLNGADGLGQVPLSTAAAQGGCCDCGLQADGVVRQVAAAVDEEAAAGGGEAATLRAELDEMLLCLGQESSKVAVLATALRAAGHNPDALIAEVEHEYVSMGLV